MAVVAADRAHVVDVLDAAERLVAARPEIELLSARTRICGAAATTETRRREPDDQTLPAAADACAAAASGVDGPGASLRALIRNAVWPRIVCCGRTARPTTSQPRCSVSHDRGSVQHCCSRNASTVRDSCVTVAT